MRPVVKESKQETLMYNQNMVAKIVTALTHRFAKLNHVQVSRLSIQMFKIFAFESCNFLCFRICLVDCKWSEFSSCSETCGQGIKTRTIDVHPKYGGKNCIGNDKESCDDRECPG
jgi:hypothetical protein